MDATSRSLSSSQLDEHAIYRPRDARCSFAELMNVQRSNHSQENEGMEGIGGIRGLWNSMVQRMWPLRFWRRIWRGYLVDRGKVMEEIVKRILTKSQIFLFFSIRIKFKVMRLYWRTFKEEEKKKKKSHDRRKRKFGNVAWYKTSKFPDSSINP